MNAQALQSAPKTAPVEQLPEASPIPGAGHRLREAREAAGLSVGEVSARMHLDQRTLRALEDDDYEHLPAPTFVRGYLRTYSQLLSVPVVTILDAYDQRGFTPPALVADIGEKPQARSSDAPMVLFTCVVAAGLFAMVVMWWQSQRSDMAFSLNDITGMLTGGGADDAAQGGAPGNAASNVTTDDIDGQPAAPSPDRASIAAVTDEARASASTGQTSTSADTATITSLQPPVSTAPQAPTTDALDPSAITALDPTAAGPAVAGSQPDTAAGMAEPDTTTGGSSGQPTLAAAQTSGAPVQVGANNEVAIQFAQESWVEIYDGAGGRLYWNLARAGAQVKVSGDPPINVVLGKADGAQVYFNGQRFDLTPYTNGGVARFKLGE